MDDSGIAAAMNMAFQLFSRTNRHTGRTERLLAAARDGDIIVTSNRPEARRLERKLQELGKSGVKVTSTRPTIEALEMMQRNHSGSIMLDHLWIEEFWARKLETIHGDLSSLVTAMSSAPAPKIKPCDGLDRFAEYDPGRRPVRDIR